jgi:hypothetical protein
MVKDFFYSIAWLFEEVFFAAYWIKKLKEFDDNGEEDKDSTSHSFL